MVCAYRRFFDGNITITIFKEEKYKVLSSASAFILPSYSESFGIGVAEAMYFALPIITTTKTPWVTIRKRNFGWIIKPNIKELKYTLNELFSSSENSEKKFMSMILQFLVYIRDHEYSKEDHKLLANRILSFCSIARISAPRTSTYNLERILKNYFGTKGRLFHISLKDIHKASNYLNLDWKLKWGWSIIITVCFEKAVDRAYSETQKVFGGMLG